MTLSCNKSELCLPSFPRKWQDIKIYYLLSLACCCTSIVGLLAMRNCIEKTVNHPLFLITAFVLSASPYNLMTNLIIAIVLSSKSCDFQTFRTDSDPSRMWRSS